MIQRVDVLTGGASAVYGADAVAGVVNFVMDTHFQGVRLDANYGYNSYKNDNQQYLGLLAAAGDQFPPSTTNAGFNRTRPSSPARTSPTARAMPRCISPT